jgi:hypothetical protein
MSNLHSLTQALEKKKAELEKLQQEIAEAREKELTALPRQVGLETVDELIKALGAFASPRMKGLLSGASTAPRKSTGSGGQENAGSAVAAGAEGGGRKRARITDEMKEQVKTLAEEGKTGAEIAEAVGISLPSVANIKKALGLTKKRGK